MQASLRRAARMASSAVRMPELPSLLLRSVAMSTSSTRPTREDLPAHRLIPTRVQDTDLLGHINNVNFYAFMDSAICDWCAARGDRVADVPRYVVETGLRYHAPAFYPEVIEVRFGVEVRTNLWATCHTPACAHTSRRPIPPMHDALGCRRHACVSKTRV